MDPRLVTPGRGHQLAHIAPAAEAVHIRKGNAADSLHRHGVQLQTRPKGNVCRHDQLVPGVNSLHIRGRIRLRIAQSLGLLQCFGKALYGSLFFYLVQAVLRLNRSIAKSTADRQPGRNR